MFTLVTHHWLQCGILIFAISHVHVNAVAMDGGTVTAVIRGDVVAKSVDIILELDRPAEGQFLYVASDARAALVNLVPGRQVTKGNRLGVRMPAKDFGRMLGAESPGKPLHRSLWLVPASSAELASAETARRIRVDLPAVDLLDKLRVDPQRDSTRLVVVAKNLLPGFRVHLSDYRLDLGVFKGAILTENAVADDKMMPYSLAPRQLPDGATELTIVFPQQAFPAEPNNFSSTTIADRFPQAAADHDVDGVVWKLLHIENLDGSCSRMLRWASTDLKLARIDEFQTAFPAPVDQQVAVPHVEGCTLDRVADLLFSQGLIPVPVHDESLAPLPTSDFTGPWLRRQVVLRQGLHPGQTALRGQRVLLTLKDAGYSGTLGGRASPEQGMQNRASGGILGAPGGQETEEGSLRESFGARPSGGGATPGQTRPPEDAYEQYIPDPERPQGGMRGGIASIENAPARGGLSENAAASPLAGGQRPPAAVAIDGAIDIAHLDPIKPQGGMLGSVLAAGVPGPRGSLTENPAAAAAQALSSRPSGESGATAAVDGAGERAGLPYGPVLISVARSPTHLFIPNVLGQTLESAERRLAGVLRHTTLDPPVRRFAKDIVVSQSPASGWSPPSSRIKLETEVAVPNVSWMRYSKAVSVLRAHGLKADSELPERQTLGCIGQDPPAHTASITSTLPRGATVRLTVAAVIPDVKGVTLREAKAALSKEGFVVKVDPMGLPGDLVVEQHHEIVRKGLPRIASWGATVELELGRPVPDVEKLSYEEAVSKLAAVGLRADASDNARPSWIVAKTEPKAGDVVSLSASVRLDLRLAVPDIQGLTLGEARRLIEDVGLTAAVKNHLAQDGDLVRSQVPRPGTQREFGAPVRLEKVVMRLPNVLGRPIGEAFDRLHDQEQFAVDVDAGLIAEDQVTMQVPAAGTEVERGTRVQLLSKVQVPNLVGSSCSAVGNELALRNLRFQFTVEPRDGDFIYDQTVRTGTWVNPRTTITLIAGTRAPNLIGRTPAECQQIMLAAGLLGDYARDQSLETDNPTFDKVSQVRSQFPAPGVPVARDPRNLVAVRVQTVTYFYVPRVIMADLRQRTTEQARAWLSQNRLDGHEVGTARIVPTTNPSFARTRIIDTQSVPPGTPIKQGSRVRFSMIQYNYIQPDQYLPPRGEGGGMGGGGMGMGGMM